MKICIGSAVWRDVKVQNVTGLLQLVQGMTDDIVYAPFIGDALVERARSKAATHFLEKTDADVLLTIDSDIGFEAEDALALCEQAMEFNIVGAVYATRGSLGSHPAAFMDVDSVDFADDPTPIPVRFLTTGFTAVHRRVFEKLAKRPDMAKCHEGESWGFHPFYHTIIKDDETFGRVLLSEDYALSERAKEEGFQSYVNPSIRVNHIGDYPYRLEDMLWRIPAERQPLRLERVKGGNRAYTFMLSRIKEKESCATP